MKSRIPKANFARNSRFAFKTSIKSRIPKVNFARNSRFTFKTSIKSRIPKANFVRNSRFCLEILEFLHKNSNYHRNYYKGKTHTNGDCADC